MARVLISLPDDLLEQLDMEVARLATSRSAFLQDAARRQLGWADPDVIDDAVGRGQEALRHAGSFDSTRLIRHQRDEQDARDRRR